MLLLMTIMKETKWKRGKVVVFYSWCILQLFGKLSFLILSSYFYRNCRIMQYFLATVVAMMISRRTFYSLKPKNDGLSLPPITIAVGIDDGTYDSSWSSQPSTEVSSPALPIKNQSFINHLDAASSMSSKDKVNENKESREVEVDPSDSDMYSKALVVHHKMSHLKHEANESQDSMIYPRCCDILKKNEESSYEKSGIELNSIAWEKHEVESRADESY